MKLQIKKFGNSKVIVLPPHFLKYLAADVDDWLNLSDAFKDNPVEFMGEDD